uniref:FH2 domain-containing protein n=1 Tax=Macrostomum lignano TaxID=282301 RepID=A0A1I8IPZ1_9PLAT
MAALDNDKKRQAVQNWLKSVQPGQNSHTVGYYVSQLQRCIRHGSAVSGEKIDLIRSLENSLRTYSVQWLEQFIEEGGLDLLIEYMGRSLDDLIRSEDSLPLLNGSAAAAAAALGAAPGNMSALSPSLQRSTLGPSQPQQTPPTAKSKSGKSGKRHKAAAVGETSFVVSGGSGARAGRRRSSSALRVGKSQFHRLQLAGATVEPDESLLNDLHNGIKCMRDKTAINIIAQCLLHPRFATKTLVLELLAALCMLDGMHQQVLDAFDFFKERVGEKRRWETLMIHFKQHDSLPAEHYCLEFMISCARFINIVQNVSNEHIGLRVFLQSEFSQLGLDSFLHSLRGHYEDARLNSQIEAIFENSIDVAGLYQDSLAKQSAVTRAAALEEQLYQTQSRLREAEDTAAERLAELRERLTSREADCATLRADKEAALEEMQNSLSAASKHADEKQHRLRHLLRLRLRRHHHRRRHRLEVRAVRRLRPSAASARRPRRSRAFSGEISAGAEESFANVELDSNTCQCVPGHRARSRIDLDDLEDKFKLAGGGGTFGGKGDASDGESMTASSTRLAAAVKKVERPTLLSHDRFRNLAVTKHKVDSLGLSYDQLALAIKRLDSDKINADMAEILLRQGLPSMKRRHQFDEGNRVEDLSEQDQLLARLCRVPRLERRLKALQFIGQFAENLAAVEPPLLTIIAACSSLEKANKFKKVLEIILAIGNYFNSHRRGTAYGFRLASLTTLQDVKSADKRWTMLQYIVNLIDTKMPELSDFDVELKHCEKAATVNLDNVKADGNLLLAGFQQLRALADEEAASNEEDSPDLQRLTQFIRSNQSRMDKMKTDLKTAEDCFNLARTRFGEGMQQVSTDAFFGVLSRFQTEARRARHELKKRREAEAAAEEKSAKRKLAEELSQRTRKHTRTIQDGALDNIMSDFNRGALLVDDGFKRKRKTAANTGEPVAAQ